MICRALLAIAFASVGFPTISLGEAGEAPGKLLVLDLPREPKRIAGTNESGVYALSELSPPRFVRLFGAYPIDSRQVLLHITQADGGPKIKRLVEDYSTAEVIPMGIDRVSYSMQRITAVAHDAERVYVLVVDGAVAQVGQLRDLPPSAFKVAGYRVAAFHLSNGELIHHARLDGIELPDELPPPSIEPGLLKVEDGRLSIHGHRFDFEGDKLVRHVAPTE